MADKKLKISEVKLYTYTQAMGTIGGFFFLIINFMVPFFGFWQWKWFLNQAAKDIIKDNNQ